MCCIVEHGTCVSGFWPCAYWWLLLQTRFAQTVQRSHRWHSQNSGSLAGVLNMMHESQLLNYQNTSMISLYLNHHHFLHGRRRLDRGACVSTWIFQTLPAPPNDWPILTIWSLWCREVFSVNVVECRWGWEYLVLGRLREFVEVPEYKSLRCMKKKTLSERSEFGFFSYVFSKGIYSWYFWILELTQIPDFSWRIENSYTSNNISLHLLQDFNIRKVHTWI